MHFGYIGVYIASFMLKTVSALKLLGFVNIVLWFQDSSVTGQVTSAPHPGQGRSSDRGDSCGEPAWIPKDLD